jgi:hypothetical protein
VFRKLNRILIKEGGGDFEESFFFLLDKTYRGTNTATAFF